MRVGPLCESYIFTRILLQKKTGGQKRRKRKEVIVAHEEQSYDEEEESSVRCKSCDHDITRPSLAIEPHEHTFRNPSGFSFHVLLYADASGALNIGEPTLEHTWFSGYAWSYANCMKCGGHLGWWFTGKDTFVGYGATTVIR